MQRSAPQYQTPKILAATIHCHQFRRQEPRKKRARFPASARTRQQRAREKIRRSNPRKESQNLKQGRREGLNGAREIRKGG
eukprot:3815052-Rhodomonas_salina.2